MPSPSGVEEKIWIAIRDYLIASKAGGILVYTKNIFEGVREIPNGGFPAIVLEPDETSEEFHTSGGTQSKFRMTQRISIHCMIEHMEIDKQIIGDGAGVQGIFDLVADVKNVLKTPIKLGLASEGVLWIRYPNTRYFFDNFPMREAIISAEIQFTKAQTER